MATEQYMSFWQTPAKFRELANISAQFWADIVVKHIRTLYDKDPVMLSIFSEWEIKFTQPQCSIKEIPSFGV